MFRAATVLRGARRGGPARWVRGRASRGGLGSRSGSRVSRRPGAAVAVRTPPAARPAQASGGGRAVEGLPPCPSAIARLLTHCTSRFELGSARASATVPCEVCRRGSGRRRAAQGGARRKANSIFIYHYRHSSTSSGSYFFCLTHITRDSDNYTFRLSLDSVTLSSTSVVLELRFIAVLGGPPSQSQPCLAAAWPLPCSAASLLPRCRYPPRCA